MRENVIWKTWPHARVKLRARLAVFGKMNIYHVRRYSPGGMAAGRKTVRTLKIRRRKSSLSALLTRMGTTFWSWELPWSRRTPWSPARWKRFRDRWAGESYTVEYSKTWNKTFWITFNQPDVVQVLQGTSPHIKNMTELEQLVEKLKAHADKEDCLMMWTPFTDREFIWCIKFNLMNIPWSSMMYEKWTGRAMESFSALRTIQMQSSSHGR